MVTVWQKSLSWNVLSFCFGLSGDPVVWLWSHISFLTWSSGHSGPVLTLRMNHAPLCPAPTHWCWTQVSGPLLGAQLWLGTYSVLFFFFFNLVMFGEIGLPFWVPGILCQHSEVIFWKFLSIQMIFWWIGRGESGLPILFLHHLWTAS